MTIITMCIFASPSIHGVDNAPLSIENFCQASYALIGVALMVWLLHLATEFKYLDRNTHITELHLTDAGAKHRRMMEKTFNPKDFRNSNKRARSVRPSSIFGVDIPTKSVGDMKYVSIDEMDADLV